MMSIYSSISFTLEGANPLNEVNMKDNRTKMVQDDTEDIDENMFLWNMT